MTTQTRIITYADYLEGPETNERIEIVDGVLIMPFRPTVAHQTISGNLFMPVYQFVRENRLGSVWHAPMDIIVQQEPLRVRQSDLMYVSNERADILRDWIYGGPDLIGEILAPGNSRSDIEDKLADYARLNVQESWLISPQARAVEVLRLDGGQWRRAYIRGVGERIESAVLPGLELDIAEIFQGT